MLFPCVASVSFLMTILMTKLHQMLLVEILNDGLAELRQLVTANPQQYEDGIGCHVLNRDFSRDFSFRCCLNILTWRVTY